MQRTILHYNLDAIIAVGYRVNSKRATAFRQWATGVLRDCTLRGYVMDRKRMENGAFLGEDYFERLLEEIREIRLSERRFYQKITDIYATAMDYDREQVSCRVVRRQDRPQPRHLGRTRNHACKRIRQFGEIEGECGVWCEVSSKGRMDSESDDKKNSSFHDASKIRTIGR